MPEELSHVGMTTCFYCLEHADILLDRGMRNSLPKECGIIDMSPCRKCEEWMEKGIILIGAKEESVMSETSRIDGLKGQWPDYPPKSSHEAERWERAARRGERAGLIEFIPNVDRTGNFSVVTEEAFSRIFNGEMVTKSLKCRWCFVTPDVIKAVGLDKEVAEAK